MNFKNRFFKNHSYVYAKQPARVALRASQLPNP